MSWVFASIVLVVVGAQLISGVTLGRTALGSGLDRDTPRGWWPVVVRRTDEPALFWLSVGTQLVLAAMLAAA